MIPVEWNCSWTYSERSLVLSRHPLEKVSTLESSMLVGGLKTQ